MDPLRQVRAGDRVGIALTGEPFVAALLDVLARGAVAVPVDLRLAPGERAARTRGCRIVLDAERTSRSARALRDVRSALAGGGGLPDDAPALVVHTSGTTSEPKEVVLTHGNVRANAHGVAQALSLAAGDRWLCPMPLTHVGGLMIPLRAALCGFSHELMPFDAGAVRERIARGDVTRVSMVPTMLARVLDAGLASSPALRTVLLGGGPVDPALVERATAAGIPVAQTYGLTEATSSVTISEPGDAATAGRPLPGVAVRVAEDGEILVEGAIVAGGGVLRTGDLGRLDAQGRLIVTGRKADTIVSGGENVAPAEVEAVLLAHPAVAEAGVFGRPDPEWGEAVSAHVVLRAGELAAPAELREWCTTRLARFKVPKTVEIVPTLPRTTSGKLLRRALR